MLSSAHRIRRSVSGVASIEFAFIAPLLAVLFLGTIQVCSVLACYQKLSNLAANVSDVIAMASSVNSTDISNAYNAGNAILYPFPSTTATIVISSVTYSSATGLDTVAWSRAQNGTPLQQGAVVNIPTGVIANTNGASAILVTVSYSYTPPIGNFFMGGIQMSDISYSRPRQSLSVACNGC
ncbi:MAG TPA: TadE/TadG family type IV pilus assembly protein [Rhizomicrobium sp.]|jgi:Flp pilus assembly protein TadG|nr:TadE/TadG family type IV pilus assembly protein [Rhizomicrobium sp.]